MLDRDDLLLAVMRADGDGVKGRTRLQKIAYLVVQMLRKKGVQAESESEFEPHYYGPYNSSLTAAVQAQVSRGLVQESLENHLSAGFPGHDFEVQRYVYALTDKGRVAAKWRRDQKPEEFDSAMEAAQKVVATKADLQVLSWAAKLHLVVKQEGRQTTLQAARERARALGWSLSQEQLQKALDVLVRLRLIKAVGRSPGDPAPR
jgi:uncharacterized protein YwgA